MHTFTRIFNSSNTIFLLEYKLVLHICNTSECRNHKLHVVHVHVDPTRALPWCTYQSFTIHYCIIRKRLYGRIQFMRRRNPTRILCTTCNIPTWLRCVSSRYRVEILHHLHSIPTSLAYESISLWPAHDLVDGAFQVRPGMFNVVLDKADKSPFKD